MNEKTRESLHQALLDRKQELTAGLARMEHELFMLNSDQESEHGGVGNHLADESSSLEEHERISTLSEDFNQQLQQISAALARMEDGTYGICNRCGKPIKVDRLRASPFAAYCIECQTYLERQASLFGTATPR
jgi:RNA polymerase-binding transcription factor